MVVKYICIVVLAPEESEGCRIYGINTETFSSNLIVWEDDDGTTDISIILLSLILVCLRRILLAYFPITSTGYCCKHLATIFMEMLNNLKLYFYKYDSLLRLSQADVKLLLLFQEELPSELSCIFGLLVRLSLFLDRVGLYHLSRLPGIKMWHSFAVGF